MITSSANRDSFHALNPNSNLNANPTYILYIRNKVPYFSSHGNVNADKGICLIAVFSVINVVIRGALIRGAEKETKQ